MMVLQDVRRSIGINYDRLGQHPSVDLERRDLIDLDKLSPQEMY
jgi:hypothetical protein